MFNDEIRIARDVLKVEIINVPLELRVRVCVLLTGDSKRSVETITVHADSFD